MAAAPQRLRESEEPSRMRLVVSFEALSEAGTCPARKVHHRADVLAVHHLQQLFGRGKKLSLLPHRDSLFAFEGESQMGVNVNDWKAGTLDRMCRNMQHASGFEVPKIKTGLLACTRLWRLRRRSQRREGCERSERRDRRCS